MYIYTCTTVSHVYKFQQTENRCMYVQAQKNDEHRHKFMFFTKENRMFISIGITLCESRQEST